MSAGHRARAVRYIAFFVVVRPLRLSARPRCQAGNGAAIHADSIGMIQSLSLSAEVTLALHNLNSEGTEGNQQQTRVVHIVDGDGKHHAVNAISGDMFKHIYVRHLTAILRELGQPLSAAAALGSPDRITTDADFKAAIRGRNAADVQTEML